MLLKFIFATKLVWVNMQYALASMSPYHKEQYIIVTQSIYIKTLKKSCQN